MADVKERGEGKGDAPRVGSIAAAIAVLRYLSQIDGGRGVNAIARDLGLNQSSCFNILKTLAAERFVSFDPATKYYALGTAPITLARRALDPANAFEQVRHLVDRAAREGDHTIGLWRLTGHPQRLLLIGHSESDAPTRIQLSNGLRIPRIAGSMGRVVAAVLGLSTEEIADEFAALRWASPPSLDDFLDDVEAARSSLWAIDRDNYAQGVTSLAVPVLDADGDARYCLSLTMFSGRPEPVENFVEQARMLAHDVSEHIFGSVELPTAVGSRS